MARKRSKGDEHELLWRAIAAWVKYADPRDLHVSPRDVQAAIVEVDGRAYVKLATGSRVLATYRIRVDSSLKRMRRPPRELRTDDDD